MLPTWYQPVHYEDLARLLLGFVASTQHKDAPEAVRRFSGFRCAIRGGLGAEPLMHAFKDKPLLEALSSARSGVVGSWRSRESSRTQC